MNTVPVAGFTPLHFAALTGQVEAARTLVNAGAHRTARSNDGHTPLQVAQIFAKTGKFPGSRISDLDRVKENMPVLAQMLSTNESGKKEL